MQGLVLYLVAALICLYLVYGAFTYGHRTRFMPSGGYSIRGNGRLCETDVSRATNDSIHRQSASDTKGIYSYQASPN